MFSINAAVLDAFVLAVLAEGDTYGYALIQRMRAHIDISESTLYPVLRRLHKNGWLETYDEPYLGRNRRYYHLNEAGRRQNEVYKQEWIKYKNKVDSVLMAAGEGDRQHDA